ncbi:MAG: serine/threonine protein phosphatase [Firmicutes bacterium HGW-Firmicutes-15]|nr:MAG: serine/threonine protein phosphatase [Firmicutes bacterium HGW-Firmicutes-15]
MKNIDSILELFINLVKNMSVVIVLAYVLTRTQAYSAIMQKKEITLNQRLGLILIFGIFSIYGTVSGINIMGAIANVRDLGPAIAGLIGGPLVGIGAGLIGGIHRYTLGGITYIPCSISTVIAGLAGGLIYQYRKGEFVSITGAVVFMALMEAFHMGLALVIVKPFSQILPIIQSVSLPMIFTNALGMGIFAFIIHNLMRERETQRTKELIESELTIAREIQMSIVPKIFPAFPGRPEFDLFAILEPAKEVGGDLYDFFLMDDNHLCFTVGDVSGKGVPASLFMAVTKTLIKAKADIRLGPDEILYQVNNELCEDNESGMFVTEFLGILTISTGDIVFSNGGHNIPYLLRKNGELEVLAKIPGMALGVVEDYPYVCADVQIREGDSLIMFTDGITEAMNQDGELFSEERLENALRGLEGRNARDEVNHILQSTRQFVNGANQSDDITILVIQYLGKKEMEYRLKNELKEIQALTAAIELFAETHKIPDQTVFHMNLSLDELLTNTISYGFPEGGEHEILVRIALQGETLVIETYDDGQIFNPLEKADPDTGLDIEERPIGGLGIHLVRKMMDEIEYRRESNQNILVMKKQIR